ncbi:hypothetical protein [Ferdinandcohnia sp. Marseille-Q9671]
MSIISRFFLLFSFLILFLNGSSLGFIFFNERFGTLFGFGFFMFTSLVGALFASIAEEPGTTKRFYCRYCLYGNFIVVLFPFYYQLVGDSLVPILIDTLL